MRQSEKEKFYFFVLAASTAILAMGVYNNYQPVVIAASCSDVAYESSKIYSRTTLETDENVLTYDRLYDDCTREFKDKLP